MENNDNKKGKTRLKGLLLRDTLDQTVPITPLFPKKLWNYLNLKEGNYF